MNCPECTTPISKPGRYCAGCGHDFGVEFYNRLTFYFDLKDMAANFNAVQKEILTSFSTLSSRIQKYEEMLGRELANPPSGVPEIPRPVVSESAQAKHTPPAGPELSRTTPQPKTFEPKPVLSGSAFTYKPQPKQSSSELEVQVGQKWLLIIGILTMVFGVGYFLKYSFDQGWIGPEGRVAMAYLWGIAFLAAGDRFRKKIERFGLSLIGGGIAVLYFSAFAAFQIYHLFDQTSSFAIMVMITVLACALAIHYDTKWLAVLGLIGGFLTPVLLTTGQDNQIALMTYMTILNIGLLGIAFFKKWDLLNTLGFIFTYLLYSAWYAQHYQASKFWPAILFLNLFFLIYALVPFTQQVRKGGQSDIRELGLMGINAFIAFAYGYAMVRGLYGIAWVSIITVVYACVFLSMATFLYQKGLQSLDIFVVMLAKAMLFLIITIPVLFSGHWITIFWSAQGLVLVWMAVNLERRSLAAGGYVLLAVSVLKFVLHDYSDIFHLRMTYDFAISNGYTYLIVERYLTSALLLIVLSASLILSKSAPDEIQWTERGDATPISMAFGLLLFLVLTAEVSSFFHDYLPLARFAAISVLWTMFSVVLMLIGFRQNNAVIRKVSFGLFLVVVLKVFLFDMSNVSTPYRIISFIILGLVLVATSYLYYRHKDRIITVLADTEQGRGNE